MQLKCLASPACSAVLTAVRALGRASAAEIAARINRSPATAHYHLRLLINSGLVRLAERRKSARKPEALFELVSHHLRLPKVAPHSVEGALTRRAVVAGLRQTMRGYEKAALADHAHAAEPHVLRMELRLSPPNIARLVEMLEGASQFADSNRTADGVYVHWTTVLFEEKQDE